MFRMRLAIKLNGAADATRVLSISYQVEMASVVVSRAFAYCESCQSDVAVGSSSAICCSSALRYLRMISGPSRHHQPPGLVPAIS